MEPIILEGNLGQRHRSLNSATHRVFDNNVPFDQIKALKEESDIDRLYKIDCANKYRDIGYILETLKCEDTLYATRALKCTWLFTEKQYEHIVNPQYLHDILFPDMITIIINKFIAKILKHTRDPAQCEQFYKYYKQIKSDRADKFITLCSPQFVDNEFANPNNFVSSQVLQYCCKKSPEAIQAYFTRFSNTDYTWRYIYSVRTLYFSNKDLYLDLLEKYFNKNTYCEPKLGYRISKDILKNYKGRVLDNITIYKEILNNTILYKSFTEEEVKQILPIIAPKELDNFWSASSKLKKYIELLKPDDRLNTFIHLFKSNFDAVELEMSKEFYTYDWYKYMSEDQLQLWALQHVQLNSEFLGLKVYSWYRFCKFDVAFTEVNKIIKTEKTPEERMRMLNVVVDTLGDSTEHAHTLLSQFKERHMNEMPYIKERFLRKLLKWNHIFKIEEKTWLLVQEIFISLGLSEDKPHTSSSLLCDAIHFNFAYCIIHDKPITDKLKSQFLKNFDNLQDLRNIVDKHCGDKLFEALYQLLEEKINETKALKVDDYWMRIEITLDQFISLFKVWRKSTTDYQHIVSYIRSVTLEGGKKYYVTKFKKLFTKEELLTLDSNENTFLFCLKSDVAILKRYMPKLNECVNRDNFRHKTFLKKIRTYFFNDLAEDWTSFLIKKLKNSTSYDEQRSLSNTITALCLLLTAQQLQETIVKYIPEKTKVDMVELDMHLFSLQKHFAKLLYLTRPPVPEVVLSFAKGDYLQYALNTLVSISVQMSSNQFSMFVKKLLNNPVSVQKHAIRLARQRLPKIQLKTLLEKLWVHKNISIKEVVFDSCFQILCEQRAPEDIDNWWHLVRKFIQEMQGDEYRSLYKFIDNIRLTPVIVQPELCMECWYCMKRSPSNNSISQYKKSILNNIISIVKAINEDFLYEVIKELLDDAFPDNVSISERLYNNQIWISLVTKYLVYCNDLHKQNERVQKVLTIILNRTKILWNETKKDIYLVREMFKEFIYSLIDSAIEEVYGRDNNYISSMALFEVIMSSMAQHLTIKSGIYYSLKFTVLYLDCVKVVCEDSCLKELEITIQNDYEYEKALHILTSEPFGKKLAQLQNSLVQAYSPLVQVFFTKFLIDYLENCMHKNNYREFKIGLIEGLIVDPSQIHNVLTALEVLPAYGSDDTFKSVIEKIISFNHIEVDFMLNMKYGENKRHKFF